ncbi:hypothetical protein C0T31_11060 [Dysgonamonadaceae bacterium]|nr:hypothetical protein C0T31_11060 [Dysgonamonadaceae bacterium]
MQKNMDNEDALIRSLLQTNRQQAPANLKYRILQQIETEKAIISDKPLPQKASRNVMREFVTIFGIMYAALALLIGAAYLTGGSALVQSPQFFWTILLVAFIFSMIWLITGLDAFLHERYRNRSRPSAH